MMNRLALGTVQLGMQYGIANSSGRPDNETARKIVAASWRGGIRYFDTAQAYGESERILGKVLRDVGVFGEERVISKLSPTVDTGNCDAIFNSLRESLTQLRLKRLWGVLLHREEQLDQWNGALGQALERARQEGLIVHAGVSVHSPCRALEALEIPGIDVLQIPANLFDRRMQRAEIVAKAASKGVTVFIRSIYLQGLALFSSQQAKGTAPFALSAVNALEQFCRANGLDQKRFVFQYARNISTEAIRIVGAETEQQVIENCRLEAEESLDGMFFREWDQTWPDDVEVLITPSLWPSPSKSKR